MSGGFDIVGRNQYYHVWQGHQITRKAIAFILEKFIPDNYKSRIFKISALQGYRRIVLSESSSQ